MIDMGDSANREKDNRFQQINNEVLEMIKAKIYLMEPQVLSLLVYKLLRICISLICWFPILLS